MGHLFALPIVSRLVFTEGAEHDQVVGLMTEIVTYIVKNNFQLIDVTKRPTTWGVWTPMMLNNNRSWSDERGVNSLQILAYLVTVANRTADAAVKDSVMAAYAELTNNTNQVGNARCSLAATRDAVSPRRWAAKYANFQPIMVCSTTSIC